MNASDYQNGLNLIDAAIYILDVALNSSGKEAPND